MWNTARLPELGQVHSAWYNLIYLNNHCEFLAAICPSGELGSICTTEEQCFHQALQLNVCFPTRAAFIRQHYCEADCWREALRTWGLFRRAHKFSEMFFICRGQMSAILGRKH